MAQQDFDTWLLRDIGRRKHEQRFEQMDAV